MCKVREGQPHLPGPRESPRVAKLSRMRKEKEGQSHLPGPSLEKRECLQEVPKLVQPSRQIPRLGEIRQVPAEEIPRVEQLSSVPKTEANLPGQRLENNNDEVKESPRVALLSSMRKVGEGQSHLPGPGESPRVAQLSSMCKVREGQSHLPGPSLTKCLRTGAEEQQVQNEEIRKTPRVAQLSRKP